MRFDWDTANIEHLARHKVEPEEAEEAVQDPAALPFAAHRGPLGQPRFGALGATEAGRVLVVVLEERGPALRVVTARPANAPERSSYLQEE